MRLSKCDADDLGETEVNDSEEKRGNNDESDDDDRQANCLLLRRPADLAKLLKTFTEVGNDSIHGIREKSGSNETMVLERLPNRKCLELILRRLECVDLRYGERHKPYAAFDILLWNVCCLMCTEIRETA